MIPLDRPIAADLLRRQGVPPHASYLFKHALVQDAAYGTLLREPRRALHARIAEAIESQFAEPGPPELLARHCAAAGLIEGCGLVGQGGTALAGALGAGGSRRAAHPRTCPDRGLARHTVAAPRSYQASGRAHNPAHPRQRLRGAGNQPSEERARRRSNKPKRSASRSSPLLLFSVLYGVWVANSVAFDGDKLREPAAQFLTLAEKQRATVPLMIGHRVTSFSLLATGDMAESRTHLDRAVALYNPAEHRRLATRFGVDTGMLVLCYRSWALWMLGYPESALADIDHALKNAREIGQAATLMFGLFHASVSHILRGNYPAANALVEELVALAEEKGALFWKAGGMLMQGSVLALTGEASDAAQKLTSRITAWRSTGATFLVPLWLSYLARAHAELRQFDDAWRCIGEAINAVEATKETMFEADIRRTAGEIALMSPEPDAAKAQACFDRALAVGRAQQAKSWELRAATSLARLWRDQGKRAEAHDLLAPVYGWFTEGFDTLDLKEAKVLLDALAL